MPEISTIEDFQGVEHTNSEERVWTHASCDAKEPGSHDNANIIQDEGCIFGKSTPVISEAVCGSEVAASISDMNITAMDNKWMGKRKFMKNADTVQHDSTLVSDDFQGSLNKQKMLLSPDVVTITSEATTPAQNHTSSDNGESQTTPKGSPKEPAEDTLNEFVGSFSASGDRYEDNSRDEIKDTRKVPERNQSSNSVGRCAEGLGSSEWKPFEKELYLKGIEMFGRNSCLIARNLLSGLKTCMEVSCYMHDGLGALTPNKSIVPPSSLIEDNGKADMEYIVSLLAFPQNGLVSLVHENRKLAMLLLIVLIAALVIFLLTFVFTIVRAAKREMHLCAALIKQMEATQKAERKSMNKIHAFASASHDICASLAGITGLIEICYDDVAPGSELDSNLRQMDTCASDLLGILNSILDTSKIKPGKMPLEEEEFDLEKLLEDIADLYHPVGNKKGVDVVLDPCDGSIKRFSQVKGDGEKLKQILCNLLSNAVKFTSTGHVTVRSWVRKPSLQNSTNASKQNCFPCLFYKNSKAYNDFETVNAAQQDANTMGFLFEVDDTGKGIPKDKQDSVFENYVQVKETAPGHEGTGLGLGIVRSLVRLMHGDIGIVDKDNGEKGTCFRFNVLLTISETASSDNINAEDLEMGGGTDLSGSISPAQSPQLTLRTPSPKLTVLTPSPKMKASHVVLLIQSNGRQRML